MHLIIRDNIGNVDTVECSYTDTFEELFMWYKYKYAPKPNPVNENLYTIVTQVVYNGVYVPPVLCTPHELDMKEYDVLYFKNIPILTLGNGLL